jgi:hypothetical protein
MSDLLALLSALTVVFYLAMLLSPALAARKFKAPYAGRIFWAGLLSGTVCLVFVSYLRPSMVFFAWVGLMVWAGIDVQKTRANRLNSENRG